MVEMPEVSKQKTRHLSRFPLHTRRQTSGDSSSRAKASDKRQSASSCLWSNRTVRIVNLGPVGLQTGL